jgi:hypothetical protein
MAMPPRPPGENRAVWLASLRYWIEIADSLTLDPQERARIERDVREALEAADREDARTLRLTG